MKLDLTEKIFLTASGVLFIIGFVAAMIKQEKISRANIEIETELHTFYSLKETIEVKPDLCISFFEVVKETRVDHCGRYTVTYLK